MEFSGAQREGAVARVDGDHRSAADICASYARPRGLRGGAGARSTNSKASTVAAMGGGSGIGSRWRRSGDGKARARRARRVYSPKNLLRLVLEGFRCAARLLGGQNAWRASSYMW